MNDSHDDHTHATDKIRVATKKADMPGDADESIAALFWFAARLTRVLRLPLD